MLASINIILSYRDLCEKIALEVLDLSNAVIASNNRFSMVLSGGSTPQGIYECMAGPGYRERFQWDKMHLWWGDERWVSPEDTKSNFRMVSQALLSKIRIPAGNIHPIPFNSTGLKGAVHSYSEGIRDFFKLGPGNFPSFDLILLGLGPDGHTASLFPGNPALLVQDRLVLGVCQAGIAEERITLSLPVINHAGTVFFVVSGQSKAGIVYQVLEEGLHVPAQEVCPRDGKLYWFLDQEAAGQLSPIPKRVGIAADHGGWQLKEQLSRDLRKASYDVIDFGNDHLDPADDYPDFVIPLAYAVARREVDRGVAICGSGVGACMAANKVAGARACMIHEAFSARQGVEDDEMNVICLGSKVLEPGRAWELVSLFLSSRFTYAPRHRRRLSKMAALEEGRRNTK